MTANQAGQVVEPKPVGTESSEQWNATETARLEEGPRSIREELTRLEEQRDELRSQLAPAQQAATGGKQRRTGRETHRWETTEEMKRARIELEQERAQRQQLETSLQEMAANPTGQVVEPEPVESESREARREEDPRSILSKEERTSLQQQRDELSSQLALAQQAAAESQQHSTASEARLRETTEDLERARVEVEQERPQRTRPEKKLQEMAAPQAVMSREQSVDDLPGRFTAPTGAATGVRESNTTQSRADEELKQQLQAMSAEAAGLREALEKKQKERAELVGRIFADGAELEQVRTALEQERAQRQQLETSLQEMTANQAGQVVEPKPVGTESSEQWNATETARLEEGPRSIREELTGLQQQRDELSSQLVLAQQPAAGTAQHSSGLEHRRGA